MNSCKLCSRRVGSVRSKVVEIVRAVVEFVKTKLPAGLASHVDGLVGDLGGGTGRTAPAAAETASADAGGMLSSVIGNIFGKKEA